MARSRQTKAERRRARAAIDNGSPRRPVDDRLARIEDALADQSRRNEELLGKLAQANEALGSPSRSDSETIAGLEAGVRLRQDNVVPVDQPLALICQAQRSGGTLLGRLFDSHPQCHAHPHELHIGERRPHTWPDLGLDEDPETWFGKLREEKLAQIFPKGKRRIPLKVPGDKADERHYPFMLPPEFQRRLFLGEVERRAPITSERQILDAYFTSLFNAWLDNQNLRGPGKRWVVAFSPRRAWGDGLDRLFELYPDGRLISIVRDPLSWFASAKGRDPNADPDGLIALWTRSADQMLEAVRRHGEAVRIVRFEELLLDTPDTMRGLAEFLEIDFDPILTTTTFNGYPVGANSSYAVRETGVVTDPVERYKDVLDEEQQARIREECEELYETVLAAARGEYAKPSEPRRA